MSHNIECDNEIKRRLTNMLRMSIADENYHVNESDYKVLSLFQLSVVAIINLKNGASVELKRTEKNITLTLKEQNSSDKVSVMYDINRDPDFDILLDIINIIRKKCIEYKNDKVTKFIDKYMM